MSERATKPKKKPAPRGANKHRGAEIAKIQIAKAWALKTLPGFTDDNYRDLLQEAGGKRSCTELDWRGRMAALKRFEELGWVAAPAKKAHTRTSPDKGRPGGVCRRLADDDQSKMARGLWIDLHTLGAVKNSSEKSLNAYVLRMAKVSDISWCNDQQHFTIIEALKDWRARTCLKHMKERIQHDFQQTLPDTLCADLQTVLRGLRIGEQPRDSAIDRLGAAGYHMLCDYKKWELQVFTR
jgi:phage gp16-like protein